MPPDAAPSHSEDALGAEGARRAGEVEGAAEAPARRRPAAWAEIDLGALLTNLAVVRACARGRKIIAVVKADAYGHGVRAVAPALVGAGVDALAVATLAEGLELRALGVALPVIVLQGLVHADDAEVCVASRLVPAVGRVESLAPLAAAARRAGVRAAVHLKVDTGMGRLGLAPEAVDAALDVVGEEPELALDGVLTQLAEADDPASPATPRQRACFAAVVRRIRERGEALPWIHADPSAAVLHGPTDVATAVRPGLMLYGADPTLDRAASASERAEPRPDSAGTHRAASASDSRLDAQSLLEDSRGSGLMPVMTVRCEVVHAKWVAAGARIGYGGTYVAAQRTRILTLPVGYADGLPRAVGGRAHVALASGLAPLVGRVSMDLATVDAGPDSTADVGDVVCVFGAIGSGVTKSGATENGVLPVEALASAAGMIPYEILTGIGPRLPRLPRG
jgi:alanine racemase